MPLCGQADDWSLFTDRVQFETADLFYRQMQLSASQIDNIMNLWSATHIGTQRTLPFKNHKDLYNAIDRIPLGDMPWKSFSLQYDGEKPADDVLSWMNKAYQICYCDPRMVIHGMLAQPDFKDNMDYVPYCKYNSKTEKREWQDFMSGDWAWNQAVRVFLVFVSNSIVITWHRMKLHRTHQHTSPHLFQ
jgi:hypothetical protein